VREWLAAMVVGGVEHDPNDGTYSLPPEHAAWLTRAATPDNIAVAAQFVPVLASVEDRIVGCFERGGGVPYSAFGRFHEVMAEDSVQTVVAALTDHILPLVPGLTQSLEDGIDVLDIGCGSGRALNLMARKLPESRFVGYDFSEEAISRARAEAAQHGATNIRFEVRDDAADLGEEGRYDLITTFDAIHDQAKPAAVLEGIAAALKDDGVYLMQDIAGLSHLHNNMDHPLGPFLYAISTMHCMTVSLAQGGRGAGHYVGRGEGIRDAGGGGLRGGGGQAAPPRLPEQLLHRQEGIAIGAGSNTRPPRSELNFAEPPQGEVRRIYLPRNRVNKERPGRRLAARLELPHAHQ
jgi:2-polyprenyl-3-methyl-5-hydroxy-6-metoxy-1,4-benzoquinol methylase